jgi:DNA primase
MNGIRDETLRRYYRDEIRSRLDALSGRAPGGGYQRGGGQGGAQRRPQPGGGRFGRGAFQPPPSYTASPPSVSASLTRSRMFSGSGGVPRREAEILLNLLNHPGLLAQHAEDLAEIELVGRESQKMRAALVALASESFADHVELRMALDRSGLQQAREAIEIAVQPIVWALKPDAAENDASEVLRQALALHRRARALHRELKSAEIALGEDANEQNLAKLREIQAELSGIEGREAAVEGFGLSSGRQGQSL